VDEAGAGGRETAGGWGMDLAAWPDTGKTRILLLTGGGEKFQFALYTVGENRWCLVGTEGLQVPRFVGHRAFITKEGTGLIVWNGMVIRFVKWGERICVLACNGMTPANRPWSSCAKVGSCIVVVGGENEVEPFMLDANAMMWGRPEAPPSQFFGAGSASTSGEMYFHGGINADGVVGTVLYRVTIEQDENVPDVQVDEDEADQWATNVLKYPQSVKDEAWIDG
jgi:hypothetical protein